MTNEAGYCFQFTKSQFISEFADKRIYVQVAYVIADGATREREFGNLHNIKDNYPKFVVSMTPGVTRNDDNGITHLNLRNFLMLGNLD